MKRLFTLLIIVFASIMARAGNNDGAISITSLSTQNVRIEVDNKNYAMRDHSIIIRNLSPGYHAIKVYLQTDGTNRTYASYNYKRQLLYSGNIRVKPQFHVDVVINRFGRALVDERFMDAAYMNEFCRDDDMINDRDNPNYYNKHVEEYRNNDNRDRNNNSYKPMSDPSFSSLWETMRKETFENTRVTLLKQSIETNYFTTMQVKQLMALFTFEDNKLDIAKTAYRNTVDKENYFQLYDSFTFSTSKENLSAFIRNSR